MELLEFIRSHENWEELLTAEPYNIKISRDSGYILFKYTQLNSDFSNPIVKECRGIILRESDFIPVCVPFFKFMNAEEPNSDLDKIDWSTASVQEKIDGSLIKVWFDNGWHISTNGTIDAFKSDLASIYFKSYGDLFVNELQYCGAIDSFEKLCKCLDQDYTYMFELVTEYNRVVVPADNYDGSIYLLGARNNKTYEEDSLWGSGLAQIFNTPKDITSILSMMLKMQQINYHGMKKVMLSATLNSTESRSSLQSMLKSIIVETIALSHMSTY